MDRDQLATAEGTARFRERFQDTAAPDWFRPALGGLSLSALGLVTSQGAADAYTDDLVSDAVAGCVALGVNVIDTAINDRFQRSERSIGKALEGLFRQGRLRRDEVLISTKGGFVPYERLPPLNPERYVQERFILPGLLPEEELVDGRHCINPDFLAHQLEQSLQNLGLEAVDLYFVHNPETQLGGVSHAEFRNRLRAAFEMLEKKADEGRIGGYGAATWSGFRVPAGAREHLALAEIVALAREAAGARHRFRAVQLPLNLMLPEALELRSQPLGGRRTTLLEAAAELGIAVFVSGPLGRGHLAEGLPGPVRSALADLKTDAQRVLQAVRSAPGVTTVLVGMKRPEHIEENLALRSVSRGEWPRLETNL
jgi:aryl-alcohol dehydrogenase-like predicted oxidoreductase